MDDLTRIQFPLLQRAASVASHSSEVFIGLALQESAALERETSRVGSSNPR